MSLDLSIERPWRLIDGEKHKFMESVITPDALIYALIRARLARAKADSYRGFSVGVCGVIYRQDGINRTLTHGANFKNNPGESSIDVHAEEFVLNNLSGEDKLMALAVIAPLQPDSASGKETATLHPCYKCRAKISATGQTTENTVIICSTPDVTAVQWGTIADYVAYHQDDMHDLPTAKFSETPALFHELKTQPGEPIHLSDPELDVDTSEWDSKVTWPIWEWLQKNPA